MKALLRSIVVALIAALVALVPEAHAAAFVKLGDIKGEATDNNHKDWIIIESMSGAIIPEKDAATGLPTGKRQHKPLTITKEIDKATPLIAQSLTRGRLIPTARIEFVRSGEQERYYQIFLKNVVITSYQTGGADGQVPTESFSLTTF